MLKVKEIEASWSDGCSALLEDRVGLGGDERRALGGSPPQTRVEKVTSRDVDLDPSNASNVNLYVLWNWQNRITKVTTIVQSPEVALSEHEEYNKARSLLVSTDGMFTIFPSSEASR